MKNYRIYQVDAFTRERFKGNPAGVVSNADGLSDNRMLEIARELNNSETAFILSPDSDDHDVRVRFFTPTTEVPSCGHATISAHYVRALEKSLDTCVVFQKIGIGILPVEIMKSGDDYRIVMVQGKIEFGRLLEPGEIDDIMSAIGLKKDDMDRRCPIQIVSTGHSKVLIGICDIDKLNSLGPDMAKLSKISERIQCNGYYVFTLSADCKSLDSDTVDSENILAHGRMFAPKIGIFEDPVTGNANGPLGAYLVKKGIARTKENDIFKFKAKQGEAIKRPGIVEVTIEIKDGKPCTARVGGDAIIAFCTEMEF